MAPTAAQQVEERALKSRSARGPCAWPCAGAKGGGQLGLSLNCLPWSGLQWPLRLAARPARWWFGQLPSALRATPSRQQRTVTLALTPRA